MPVLRDTGSAIRCLQVEEEEAGIHLKWEQWPHPQQRHCLKELLLCNVVQIPSCCKGLKCRTGRAVVTCLFPLRQKTEKGKLSIFGEWIRNGQLPAFQREGFGRGEACSCVGLHHLLLQAVWRDEWDAIERLLDKFFQNLQHFSVFLSTAAELFVFLQCQRNIQHQEHCFVFDLEI